MLGIDRINPSKEVVIVEAMLDCLHARAKGIENVVALGGAGFNYNQAELLKKMGVSKITLCLDSDKAGQEASIMIGCLIYDKIPDAQIKIAKLPQDVKDFDELIKTQGAIVSKEVISKAEIKHESHLEQIKAKSIEQQLSQGIKLTPKV